VAQRGGEGSEGRESEGAHLIGVARGRFGNELKRGGEILAGAVSGGITGRRKKKVTWPDMWDPHVSEGERRKSLPVRNSFLGHGLVSVLGQMVSPGPLYVFFPFLLFSFSIFFILL
jgi:hypothetical protein